MLKKGLVSLSTIAAMVILTSCGGGGSSTDNSVETTTYTGYLVDSAVAGATYQCGDKNDTTDSEGKFECTTLPVSFSIGGIQLGQISKLTTDSKIFPQDLVGVDRDDTNNSDVVKMAMVLQSLDSDGNASNGISINEEQAKKFKDAMDLKSLELEVIKEMMMAQDDALMFKNEEEVKAHLQASVAKAQEAMSSATSTNDLVSLLNGVTLYADYDHYIFSLEGDIITINWETLVGDEKGDTGYGTWKIEGDKLIGLTGDGNGFDLTLANASDEYIEFLASNGEKITFYYNKPWESSSTTTPYLVSLLSGKTLYADNDQYVFSANGDIITINWETLVGDEKGDTGYGTWKAVENRLVGLTGDGNGLNLDLTEATDEYVAFSLPTGEVIKFYYNKPWEQ